ncbi:MAG: DNA integrity scanning diadenylate cyclase DisA [Sarcina sp.]
MRLENNNELKNILKIMSPGTPLREGLENILRAKTGGLIVLSDKEEVLEVVDGGFKIDSSYSPAYIYELAKMDGALIVSSDLKRILVANAQLMPNPSISTFETGTRHRTAQRVAKQTGCISIAISQRRNMISIYKSDIKYVLRDSSIVLSKANQAIQTLERYIAVLDKVINNLNILEFQDLATFFDVTTAIQRTEMVMRIVQEIDGYIIELGNEGRLISMQLNELVSCIEQDGILLIRDYCKSSLNYENIYREIQKLNSDELIDLEQISKLLGNQGKGLTETFVSPRGYRIANKVPRIPAAVIENLVEHFGNLKDILEASKEELDMVEGIGEARARAIRNGLRRIQEQVSLKK